MKEWLKLWWHCVSFNPKWLMEHRMCWEKQWINGKRTLTRRFCTCGYKDTDKILKDLLSKKEI